MSDDLTVRDLECIRMLAGFPSVERVAVKERYPTSGIVAERTGGRWCGKQQGNEFATCEYGHESSPARLELNQ
jgi:hypothetical protein